MRKIIPLLVVLALVCLSCCDSGDREAREPDVGYQQAASGEAKVAAEIAQEKRLEESRLKAEAERKATEAASTAEEKQEGETQATYIANKNSGVFHKDTCKNLPKEENRVYVGTREEAVGQGYRPCKNCDP